MLSDANSLDVDIHILDFQSGILFHIILYIVSCVHCDRRQGHAIFQRHKQIDRNRCRINHRNLHATAQAIALEQFNDAVPGVLGLNADKAIVVYGSLPDDAWEQRIRQNTLPVVLDQLCCHKTASFALLYPIVLPPPPQRKPDRKNDILLLILRQNRVMENFLHVVIII